MTPLSPIVSPGLYDTLGLDSNRYEQGAAWAREQLEHAGAALQHAEFKVDEMRGELVSSAQAMGPIPRAFADLASSAAGVMSGALSAVGDALLHRAETPIAATLAINRMHFDRLPTAENGRDAVAFAYLAIKEMTPDLKEVSSASIGKASVGLWHSLSEKAETSWQHGDHSKAVGSILGTIGVAMAFRRPSSKLAPDLAAEIESRALKGTTRTDTAKFKRAMRVFSTPADLVEEAQTSRNLLIEKLAVRGLSAAEQEGLRKQLALAEANLATQIRKNLYPGQSLRDIEKTVQHMIKKKHPLESKEIANVDYEDIYTRQQRLASIQGTVVRELRKVLNTDCSPQLKSQVGKYIADVERELANVNQRVEHALATRSYGPRF